MKLNIELFENFINDNFDFSFHFLPLKKPTSFLSIPLPPPLALVPPFSKVPAELCGQPDPPWNMGGSL